MKLKNYWKRFWTMDRHHAAGFTLVELIVVIAILAILAGVGIPVYSGYITKANKGVDETLISEIAHALELAYYANGDTEVSGYVILSKDAAPIISGTGIEETLQAVFGDSINIQRLKYDGWTANSAMLNTVAGQKYAASVGSSSYLQNSDIPALLDNVALVTGAATDLLKGLPIGKTNEDLYNSLSGTMGSTYISMGEEIGLFANGAVKDGVTSEQLSNLMVLAVSEELSAMSPDKVVEMMTTNNYEGVSLGTSLAIQYAAAKAAALSLGEKGAAQFNQMNANLQNATNVTEVNNALASFTQTSSGEVDADFQKAYVTYMYPGAYTGDATPSDKFVHDAEAFTAIMGGVASVSGNYADADKLADADLYTSSGVAGDVTGYVNAAALTEVLTPEQMNAIKNLQDGEVVIAIAEGVVTIYPAG